MLVNEMANLNNVKPNRYEKNYCRLLGGYDDTDNYSKEVQDIDLSLYKKLKKISLDDLEIGESLGKGSFGEVKKAYWNGTIVAVKKAENNSEVKAFVNEVNHLARASHENIIHLFGVASDIQSKYLIMEYADGGSLYNFLHIPPFSSYNIINALSWLMQCARAIDYLHSYQPKAVIHRDLKSLNMLLKNGKKILKICDFGTACEQSTIMTDNKGSVAWMAPEVMMGNEYNEKCDIYSYGMFIWEILTRKIPAAEFTHHIRIMFKVLHRWRPPLIKYCPNPIQELMTRCWDHEFNERPSMKEVLQIVTRLFQFTSGLDEPADYISSSESSTDSRNSNLNETNSEGQTSRDVSEFPTDSTCGYHGNTPVSKKQQLLPIESNSSSLMDFDESCDGKRTSDSNSNFGDSSSAQEDEFDPYEPIAIFKEEPVHVPRPVFKDKYFENVSQDLLLPLNINIPEGEFPERNDVCLSLPKTSKIDVKISPRPSTIFPSNYPTANYHRSKYLPTAVEPPTNIPSQGAIPEGSPNRPNSYHQSPIADATNCFAYQLELDGRNYQNLPPPMRNHDLPRDPAAVLRRRSAEVSHVDGNHPYGHRRSSSYDSGTLIGFEPLEIEINSDFPREQNQCSNNLRVPGELIQRHIGYGESASKPADRNHQLKNISQLPTKDFWPMVATPKPEINSSELGDLWQYLDDELKPAKTIPSCAQSQKIYENHKEMAHDLLVVQEKIFFLNQAKKKLLDMLQNQEVNHKSSKQRYHNRITDLQHTNQTLRKRQHELKLKLDQIQAKKRQQEQITKIETSFNHNEHLYHQPDHSSPYQRQIHHHSQGHTPYCTCYENSQSTAHQPSGHKAQKDTYIGNSSNAQSQNHISHCSHHDSYYRH